VTIFWDEALRLKRYGKQRASCRVISLGGEQLAL
jgi:hypothetical protein